MFCIEITGASGFVGSNLSNYLKSRGTYNINALTRKCLEQAIIPNREHEQTIVHLAGKAHDLKKTSNPEEYYQVNFELTKKLYDAFLKSNARKFIFISSVKAAADSISGILEEDVVPSPQTDYGKSKLMAEEYIQSQPLPEGKSYHILRPCMIHGPGNKGNLNLLFGIVKKGFPYPLTAFRNRRSFLSVENLCFVIEGLIKKDVPSGIYNVSDDEALSTSEVVTLMAKCLGKKAKLFRIPPSFIKALAKIGDLGKLPLNSERLQKLTENYEVSNIKIKKALSADLPFSTKDGLRRTISSFIGV